VDELINLKVMNYFKKEQLERSLMPVLIDLWNSNNTEKVQHVSVKFVYMPTDFNGTNPPKVRFTLLMRNGRTQFSLDCDKVFVELFDDIMLHTYKRTLELS